MSEIIQIERVSKRFGAVAALDQISLSVRRGEVFALLGENGAGKTTLLRILTGFLASDEGRATILGLDCQRDGNAIRQRIGYVSDQPPMYQWMTAPEIGWFASGFYDDDFTFRYHQSIREFDIPMSTKIGKMSKGQRAKVALALATAHDPELLILDEPTSGLDPMVRRQFLESMVDRAASGRSVLLSSHHIHEVERVADTVAIVHQGKLRLVESLEVLRQHTRIITATMDDALAEPPMVAGTVLCQSQSAKQHRWVAHRLSDDWHVHFESEEGVRQYDSKVPTLEDIFIAACQSTSVGNELPQQTIGGANRG
ncbi:MAG: ABC transporter ATP-binding protein [Planctomycetota bacterium]